MACKRFPIAQKLKVVQGGAHYDINKNNLLMVTHAKILSTTKCMQLEMLTRRLSFARDLSYPPL